ncbi:DUF5677 domain-containing protein [Niabella beijingensis]|uniref:DUF5677 domain-containing protein n=1 Tax=Niabella beijingensis TaxID=2872700 RepID=UPI001CC0B2E6|nr:DUF5677 domain-containing protein [Niabella beijingensis]MBZ4189323.1 hypothetical protein [Niabella beijingensis]
MESDFFSEMQIGDTENYKKFVADFDKSTAFLDDLSNLIDYNGRIISFFTDDGIHYFNTCLLDNAVQTLQSIKLCCSIGSFADANTLIRKLRDDLVMFVYIRRVIDQRKPFVETDLQDVDLTDADKLLESFSKMRINPDLTDDEKAVAAWLSNKVSELPWAIKKRTLSYENYMIFLAQHSGINEILAAYNLQNYWEQLRQKLNNYVHNNGQQFSAINIIRPGDENVDAYLKNVYIRTSYITTFFLVLIIMVDATLISSSDMIDYLDSGKEPPENCQYEVAPFIQEYIDKEVVRLHPELKQYLKDNNGYGMKIN